MLVKVEREIGGRMLSLETGELAKQADGATLVRYADTVVFNTAVSEVREKPRDFLPFLVDYREKTSAAGKIPGGFIKREGRPTTKEILTMRMIDRPLRSMFPEHFTDEVQIMSTVLSADQENDPDLLGIIGSSAALSISKIPFNDPVGTVRVGLIDSEFVLNPTHTELKRSDLDLVVTGTEEKIIMMEGGAAEVEEKVIIDAIEFAQKYIREVVELQKELIEKLDVKKVSFVEPSLDDELLSELKENYYDQIKDTVSVKDKKNRSENLSSLFDEIVEKYSPEEDEEKHSELLTIFNQLQKKAVRTLAVEGKRCDGRGFDDVRPISCRVGLLPRAHGSALFTRGETQAMVSATLGTSVDEQIVDGLKEEYSKKFILHYNFPPFSVGEIKPIRGPARREIGHGALAEKSLEPVLPHEDKFPYTIRIVSDILESNGSSSMATVCGTTLSLMDAGVPIKFPVAGIAMGLIKEADEERVLTDIIGIEDAFGDTDFKVAGTQNGITAIQMDVKNPDIDLKILEKLFKKAKEGRLFILRKMLQTLDRPRKETSIYAPKLRKIKIPEEKIGLLIGPGGTTIRGIQEDTGVTIEVDDDGVTIIYSMDQESVNRAAEIVEKLVEEVKIGRIYEGEVKKVVDFGAFVEILPGQEGLLHISEISDKFVDNIFDEIRVGEKVSVKVLGIDDQNKIKLSKRAVRYESK